MKSSVWCCLLASISFFVMRYSFFPEGLEARTNSVGLVEHLSNNEAQLCIFAKAGENELYSCLGTLYFDI